MTRIGEERGWALVTAVVLMTLMMSLGLASFAYVDVQQREAGRERVRESSFNLTEGVLSTEAFIVARRWPEDATTAFPAYCTHATVDARCPTAATVAATFAGGDYGAASSWSVTVRDNGPDLPETAKVEVDSTARYDARDDDDLDDTDADDDLADLADDLDDTGTDAQPTWDRNGDDTVWIRAQATLDGRRRTLVARARVDELAERFPRHAVTAGSFATSNNGNKVIVDLLGTAAKPGPLAVRCAVRGAGCLDYDQGKGQVSPDTPETILLGWNDGGRSISAAALERLTERARSLGTYYASCPANPSGTLVVVEQGDCSYDNSVPGPCCNTAAAPGIFIIKSGTFRLGGNLELHGLVYAANLQGSSGMVVETQGTSLVHGGIAIDGAGGLEAGSSGLNVEYDGRVFDNLRSYPSGAVVPGTWRELPG